ncbi:hypothetical protein [Polyangium jinanense]|uniref:Uncharacterized protein n=1 Tax=Polyangium jinanense TaxID=2829994 RepID=A0A9X3X2L0_9BACT|nr:hypothetical protein [Polyangium jinanense]MDC3954760.1 hypothetical protein [Polyangium jinanense]MDC3961892.1 hypothetical protein [Polyangium jinanense]MDC3981063.1 hypothetical protein [Polyangium jinanense]
MLEWLRNAWRKAFSSRAELPQVEPAVQVAVARCYRESFPERMNPPVSFSIVADENDYFVVAASNLEPGCLDFFRVAKDTHLATLVEEDQLKYRPRNLK